MASKTPIVEVKNLYKSFRVGRDYVPVLKGLSLSVSFGEFIIIFGPSGCGKSTLLNTVLGLEKPVAGEVLVRGQEVYHMDDDQRAVFRHDKFGVIYQQSNWIKSLNVVENIAFPLDLAGGKHRHSIKRALHILHLFKLDQFAKYHPLELSGGQQQKLAVCRALVTNPRIILADEPTGNLDTASAGDLMYMLKLLNESSKKTIILVTHNPEYEHFASKAIFMEDGMIKNIVDKKNLSVSEDQHRDILEVGSIR
jgi:putative ABC transport system ATP-binding protein